MSGDLLGPFRSDPSSAGLFVDFDGTLSPIVDDPQSARPADGAVEVLSLLAPRLGAIVVSSGRPVEFLADQLPDGISIVGLYGLAGVDRGVRWEHPNGGVWREVVADVAAAIERLAPAGIRVEPKGLSLTVHYRGRPDLADVAEELARAQGVRAGLLVRSARMSVELHPPIESDKGTVVERYVDDLTAVMVAGDDLGDLPAYDALDRLAECGVHTVRVAVASVEAPVELTSRADIVVDGPADFVELLRSLT